MSRGDYDPIADIAEDMRRMVNMVDPAFTLRYAVSPSPEEKQLNADKYLEAAEDLAAARVRYADQFTAARFTLGEKGTDGRATQIAIAVTGDEITVLTAKLAIAAHRADMYTPYMTIVKEEK